MTVFVDISFQKSERSKRVILNENDELVIGRSNDESLMTPDPRLSRRHFVIRHVNGAIEVEHLSRTNPTLVAEGDSSDFQEVDSVRTLNGGCRIIAGFHRFVVTLENDDTVLQSSLPEFDVASSWNDVEDDEEVDPPQPVTRTRQTQQARAPYSFEDSVDDSPRQKPDSKNLPKTDRKRKVISFESEYVPNEPSRQSDSKSQRTTTPIKISDVLLQENAAEDSTAQPPTPRSTANKPQFNLDDSSSVAGSEKASEDSGTQRPSDKSKTNKDVVKENKNSFPKKLNFPVTDSFFDD